MTSMELKQYIKKNKSVETILLDIGCMNIHFHEIKQYYSASNPDGDNKSAINIKLNDYLSYCNYTRDVSYEDKQDIFNLIQTVKGIKFVDAIKYVHKLLGLKYEFSPQKKEVEKPKFDPLAIFKKAAEKKRICYVNDVKFLDENILHDFYPGIHIDWFRQGIMPWSAKKFGLCYSYKYKRQVVPIRYWLDGRLMGYNARTTVEDYDLFEIDKYFLTPGMNKSMNLYGLWENKNNIEQVGSVVIFEAEKSVLKRDSLGDSTGVAVSGHSLSEEQVRILLGLEIHEIVIAMDKDIDLNEIRSLCEKFYRIRKVSYIYDKWGLLNSKDSPADASSKIYQFLFKYRVEYTEEEHLKYLKSLEKKK